MRPGVHLIGRDDQPAQTVRPEAVTRLRVATRARDIPGPAALQRACDVGVRDDQHIGREPRRRTRDPIRRAHDQPAPAIRAILGGDRALRAKLLQQIATGETDRIGRRLHPPRPDLPPRPCQRAPQQRDEQQGGHEQDHRDPPSRRIERTAVADPYFGTQPPYQRGEQQERRDQHQRAGRTEHAVRHVAVAAHRTGPPCPRATVAARVIATAASSHR